MARLVAYRVMALRPNVNLAPAVGLRTARNTISEPDSEDPPQYLACGTFNVLQIFQQQASNRFAGNGEDRSAATSWQAGETGVPLLTGSLGSFECKRYAMHEGEDHFVLFGEVVRAQYEPRRDPLLYFWGEYRRLLIA